MDRADKSRLVGIVADNANLGLNLIGLEQHRGTTNCKLADAACTKPPADHEAFGVLPLLELQEAAEDNRKLLCKGFYRALDDARHFGLAACQQRVEAFLLNVDILKPAANDVLQCWPVSRRVNSSRAPDDDASLIEAVAARAGGAEASGACASKAKGRSPSRHGAHEKPEQPKRKKTRRTG